MKEQFEKVLDRLLEVEGAMGGVITSEDGIIISSKTKVDMDAELLGALASGSLTSVQKLLDEAKLGKLESFVLEGEKGKVLLSNLPSVGIIVFLIGSENMNLGLAKLTLERASEDLEREV